MRCLCLAYTLIGVEKSLKGADGGASLQNPLFGQDLHLCVPLDRWNTRKKTVPRFCLAQIFNGALALECVSQQVSFGNGRVGRLDL
jgi:hypothetical protein